MLNKHGVRYVVIGGVAAEIHDLPVPATVDIDVTPARDRRNLDRLALAFDELEAVLSTAEEAGTWFPRTPVDRSDEPGTLVELDELTRQAVELLEEYTEPASPTPRTRGRPTGT